MHRILSVLLLASSYASIAQATYTVQTNYSGTNFFNGFDFFTGADPTHGNVTFLDEVAANATGLAGFLDIGNGTLAIYMAADSTSEVPDGSGRGAVRVSSNQTFQHGLIVVDILHMPTGCGTWPAFWMVGADWPNDGEIDIVEGVNQDTQNSMTLHTSPGFSVAATEAFSGDLLRTDCSAHSATLGCSISDNSTDNSNITFGPEFNDNQGGVYATQWTSDFIKIWFFPRNSIPADVNSDNPDPTGWGTPVSLFASNGTSTIDDHFKDLQIIFDTTFCGGLAGQQDVWDASECSKLAPTCDQYVLNTPSAFTEAYWAVNSLVVYQDDGNTSGSGTNSTIPPKLRRRRR